MERAGTAGKCPKCGVPFVVPSAEVAAAAASSLSSSSLAASDSSGPGSGIPIGGGLGSGNLGGGLGSGNLGSGRLNVEVASGDIAPRAPVAPPIIFLCPNGHKLNCPPSMQGKAGKCPHCGARFLIPSADESYSDDDSLDEGSEFEAVEGSGKNLQSSEGGVDQTPPSKLADALVGSGPPDLPPDFIERIRQSESAQSSAPHSSGHANTALTHAFRELWGQRGRGAVLRIHLRSGAVIMPDRYAAQASDDECAIFAVKEADGGYSISAIAWAQVERISLDGLKTLPEDLFH